MGRSNPSAERRESMAYDYRSLPFDRHSPTTAIGQLEYTIPGPSVHVNVYVSLQRSNTWVAKRSISYNTYSYILRRHTRHPVELLRTMRYRGQRRINVSVRTKRPDRVVVGSVLRRKLQKTRFRDRSENTIDLI